MAASPVDLRVRVLSLGGLIAAGFPVNVLVLLFDYLHDVYSGRGAYFCVVWLLVAWFGWLVGVRFVWVCWFVWCVVIW